MAAALVGRGLATMRELETYYSYEDALNLLEILQAQSYNQWAAAEEMRHG